MSEATSVIEQNHVAAVVAPKVTRSRSLLKALSYRAVVTLLNFFVIYFFTHRTDIALGFTVVNGIYTSIAYYFHERIWTRVEWGRE